MAALTVLFVTLLLAAQGWRGNVGIILVRESVARRKVLMLLFVFGDATLLWFPVSLVV